MKILVKWKFKAQLRRYLSVVSTDGCENVDLPVCPHINSGKLLGLAWECPEAKQTYIVPPKNLAKTSKTVAHLTWGTPL